MSPGTPEWIHSCMLGRKREGGLLRWESPPVTQAPTHRLTYPLPHEQTPGTGAHDMRLYIDHGVSLKRTFIRPHTSTYLDIPSTHTNLFERSQAHKRRLVQTGFSPLSQVQPYWDIQVYTNISTHIMCPHKHKWPVVPRCFCAQTHPFRPKFRLHRKEATSFSACDPGEAASGCSELPLLSRPATTSGYSQRPTPHQEAPDSSGTGFGMRTTTPGTGGGGQAAARGAEEASALGAPGPCGLVPLASPERTVVGAHNVGLPGAGGPRRVCSGTRAEQGPAH